MYSDAMVFINRHTNYIVPAKTVYFEAFYTSEYGVITMNNTFEISSLNYLSLFNTTAPTTTLS